MSHPPASRPSRSSVARPSAARPSLVKPPRRRAITATCSEPLLSPHRKKVLWAGGAITLLAMATILPTQVSSQAMNSASCEQVVKSGAEMSRGQLSKLLTFSQGTRKAAVRQAMNEPYCTMPILTSQQSGDAVNLEREAYPLAFDPEAWVVLSYEADEYMGYDIVFKP